ncbi:MAG: DUF4440 domain-containing protein [Vicinamibacteraceae bacterium]|nr:DUF4440 domain-containing protein [Vicinamibacteraceae bacterium]
MRYVMTLLLGVVAGAALVLASPESRSLFADAETRRAVAAVKQGIVDGHRTRDRRALAALYADDYTALDGTGGVRAKSDLLDGLASAPEMIEGRYELRAVRRWGNIAVASGHGRMLYRQPDGSTRVAEYDSVNVFELRDGRWQYVAAFLP